MTSQGVSRKRPAPGTSPVVHQQMPSYPPPNPGSQLSNDQFLQWGQNPSSAPVNPSVNPTSFPDMNSYNAAPYPPNPPPPPPPNPNPNQNPNQDPNAAANQSNQLTRRPMNQLVSRNPRGYDQPPGSLMDHGGGGSTAAAAAADSNGWGESLAELEQRALIAKREAQAKRKQIPPFVQKLSSFLDESKNTDLIRWSDDGNSFIVLDEDEFAKTLIPELFKHNNYASFVRQLNMYGFHKKVGLSDNSMRASERKNKSPSEYANPYFKRGHPDLLWLIQKPKNNVSGGGSKSGKGRVKTEEAEDNEGDDYGGGDRDDNSRKQLQLQGAQGFLGKEQLANVYRELQAIRQQQQIISQTINKLRREHEQLYAQAANFQEQHNRHENSINAILTFLATVYNRSLQGHDGTQNITNSFAGAIPQDQGNVVDMGDEYALSTLGGDMNSPGGQRSAKKQPLLLKAPPPAAPDRQGRANTLSPSGGNSYDQAQRRSSHGRQPSTSQSGHVEELFDVNSPQQKVPPQQNHNQNQRYPQRDIMSVIQNSNARNGLPTTTFADFPNVLSSLENSGGNAPLTPNQRADMLRLMANETSSADPSATASSNNALITPTPPTMAQSYAGRLASTRAELDNLAKMQAEQDRQVQNLTNLLQPLSPTGTIPGLGDDSTGTIPPPPLDLDQIFNSNDYFTDMGDIEKSGLPFGDPAAGQTDPVANPGVDATKDANDLFDFDNLPAGPEGDLFDDPSNPMSTTNQQPQPQAQPQPQPQSQPQPQPQPQQQNATAGTGYFNGYDVAGAGFNNGAVGTGTDSNLPNTNGTDAGRIVETFTDSDAPSPANTVDENVQLNVANAGSDSGGGQGNGGSVKRRKKA